MIPYTIEEITALHKKVYELTQDNSKLTTEVVLLEMRLAYTEYRQRVAEIQCDGWRQAALQNI